MTDFAGKGKVAVLKLLQPLCLEDISKLMKLANFQESLPKEHTDRIEDQYFLANLVSSLFFHSLAN